MNISAFMQEFMKDLELDTPLPQEVPGVYSLPLEEGLTVVITSIPSGFSLSATLAAVPRDKEELFYTRTLLGNLFGQGTRGAVLALSEDGRMLTISRVIDYDVNYKEFKDLIEDFINSVDFWREEALNYQ